MLALVDRLNVVRQRVRDCCHPLLGACTCRDPCLKAALPAIEGSSRAAGFSQKSSASPAMGRLLHGRSRFDNGVRPGGFQTGSGSKRAVVRNGPSSETGRRPIRTGCRSRSDRLASLPSGFPRIGFLPSSSFPSGSFPSGSLAMHRLPSVAGRRRAAPCRTGTARVPSRPFSR